FHLFPSTSAAFCRYRYKFQCIILLAYRIAFQAAVCKLLQLFLMAVYDYFHFLKQTKKAAASGGLLFRQCICMLCISGKEKYKKYEL
ncbi:hypothetical protein RCG42_00255, partial [Lactobacillus delbrueckii subsp. lactis]